MKIGDYRLNDIQLENILNNITKTDSNCWLWKNGELDRAGTIRIHNGKRITIRAMMYVTYNWTEFEKFNDKRLECVNLCGDRHCVRPEHTMIKGTEKYFWSQIDVGGDDDCWLWTGNVNKGGYGVPTSLFDLSGTPHRLIYAIWGDEELSDDNEVLHVCNTKLCCNPRHLQAGTHYRNMREANDDGLWENRIDKKTAIAIKYEVLDSGLSLKSISDSFNVPYQTVVDIKNLKSWLSCDKLPDGRYFSEHVSIVKSGTLYVISNSITDRVYVGFTKRPLTKRLSDHKTKLKNNKHPAHVMQDDFNIYGWDSFNVLDQIAISNCNWKEAEIALIHQYRDAGYKLYNTEHI